MGIVSKQGIYSSVASYIGIVIGAINTILLFPNFFTSEQFGLTRVLIAAATIAFQFSSLGITNVTYKFFPFFQDKEKGHNGFLPFILLVSFVGYLLFLIVSYFFEKEIIQYYSNNSPMVGDYYNYILVLTFFIIFFNVIDAYLRSLLKTVIFVFLQSVLLRLMWLALILLYHYEYISFDVFMFWFVNVYGILLLIEIIYTAYIKELYLQPSFKKLDKSMLKKISIYGVFVFLGLSTGGLVTYVDVLMIGGIDNDGLNSVAIYSVAIYIAALITVPYGSIIRVAVSIISDAWKKNDIKKIETIYKQTSNNLMLIGLLIFLGIWLNVDSIFEILPDKYAGGKYVILFVCLAKLYDVATGINSTIIQFSTFYKLTLYMNIILVVLIIGTNYLFIPIYGIIGAAVATMASIIIVNTVSLIIIKVKMDILPFNLKSFLSLLVAGATYLVVICIPKFDYYVLDVIVRSAVIIGMYVPIVYLLKISQEFNNLVDRSLTTVGLKK